MKALLQLVAAAALLSGSLGAQAAGSLVITPTGSTVSPGSSFAVQVRGSGFSDNVVGGGLNLSFDPGVLALTGSETANSPINCPSTARCITLAPSARKASACGTKALTETPICSISVVFPSAN